MSEVERSLDVLTAPENVALEGDQGDSVSSSQQAVSSE